ncbi:MAG: hypothetical protein HY243_17885 [Proteobacteria bacterium]|nr:hypothetical protein [Pseudomonadota bacterium]
MVRFAGALVAALLLVVGPSSSSGALASQDWISTETCNADPDLAIGTDVQLLTKGKLVQKRFAVSQAFADEGLIFDVSGCGKEKFHTVLKPGIPVNDGAFHAIPIFHPGEFDFLVIDGDEEIHEYIVYAARQNFAEVLRFSTYNYARATYSKLRRVYTLSASQIIDFRCANGAKQKILYSTDRVQQLKLATACRR